jgi:hypothetical protein
MGQALPDGAWKSPNEWYPPDDVSAGSPPISLSYRMSPGTSDQHDPERGLIIIDRYTELGIGNKAENIHSLSSHSQLYDNLDSFSLFP